MIQCNDGNEQPGSSKKIALFVLTLIVIGFLVLMTWRVVPITRFQPKPAMTLQDSIEKVLNDTLQQKAILIPDTVALGYSLIRWGDTAAPGKISGCKKLLLKKYGGLSGAALESGGPQSNTAVIISCDRHPLDMSGVEVFHCPGGKDVLMVVDSMRNITAIVDTITHLLIVKDSAATIRSLLLALSGFWKPAYKLDLDWSNWPKKQAEDSLSVTRHLPIKTAERRDSL
jgi:hypothetical protein